MKVVSIKSEKFSCNIRLKEKITLLTGNSGEGKTYIEQFIELLQKAGSFSKELSSSKDIFNIAFAHNVVAEDFDKLVGDIIFIDNFSTQVTKEVLRKIDSSNKYFILVVHRPDSIYFGNSPYGLANLRSVDGVFRLEYIFDEGLEGYFKSGYSIG